MRVQSGMQYAKDGTPIWSPWGMGLRVQQSLELVQGSRVDMVLQM